MEVLFLSNRIYTGHADSELFRGGILATHEGKICRILRSAEEVNSYMYNSQADEIYDFEDKILMPGLIDVHVYVNDPGRKDWEGFSTATKSAAVGGFTTIVDMPLNSIPPTTTVENLKLKSATARGKIYTDVAFWGGIVPENLEDISALHKSGVVGFKCFLCPSGVDEFKHVNEPQIEAALGKLENTGSVLAFHAEVLSEKPIPFDTSEPKKYQTFLNTRPASMEKNAVELISKLSQKHKNIRMHISDLSSADVISTIRECRSKGGQLTVGTCPHYLALAAEDVPDSRTEFKCHPPIRERANQERLWQAIVNKDVDLVTSSHSPCTPGLKLLNYGRGRGDFTKAWSGVASNQLGLSIFWTNCTKYDLGVKDVHRLMCQNPAKLCSLDSLKGKIEEGYDADFCVWDPDEEFLVYPDMVQFRNKANPYMDTRLKGIVHATIVRGLHVFQQFEGFGQPLGKVILQRPSKKIVKFN